jgi:hypothetical protein
MSDTPTNVAIDLFEAFATNTVAEEQGVETQISGLGDTVFKLARVGNPNYNRLLDQLYRKNKTVLESKGSAANAKSEAIMAEVYAKTILLGWQGTVMIRKVPTAYSYESALLLCGLKDLREKFASAAADFNTFKVVADKEDEKN